MTTSEETTAVTPRRRPVKINHIGFSDVKAALAAGLA